MKFDTLSKAQKKAFYPNFRYGIEAEFLVVRKSDFAPLWHHDLNFEDLNAIFESIDLAGSPSCEGLDLEPPQTKLMPFVVEGYHLPDMDNAARELLPKGVEIRTPVCESIEECLNVLGTLHTRLREKLAEQDLDIVCLSHHPLHSKFSGPQNKRRHDYWQWSMEVMTTYGPDINVSIPAELADRVSEEDFTEKINYYGPALSALSVASPFVNGAPWSVRGQTGKSYRMHKRSYIAPPIEFHPDEKNRYEFKVFDMPSSRNEFEAQILSFLALLLDDGLQGRADKQARIYDLGQVAMKGLEADQMRERATELLSRAEGVLGEWGINSSALRIFNDRLTTGRTPADEMLTVYNQRESFVDVFKSRQYRDE